MQEDRTSIGTVMVSAMPYTKGEKVLEAMVNGEGNSKYDRTFGTWHVGASGFKECHGEVGEKGKAPVPVVLIVGRVGHVPLVDVCGSRWRPRRTSHGYAVTIGRRSPMH